MSRFKDYFTIIEKTIPMVEEGKYGLTAEFEYKQVKPLNFADLDLEPKESIAEHLRRQYKQKTDIDISALVVMEALEKAKQYDKLSNELGCPLEVVFKAIKSNVWNNKTKRQEWVVLDYSNGEFVLKTTKELYVDDNKSILPLKEYGTTWWLKGEKE